MLAFDSFYVFLNLVLLCVLIIAYVLVMQTSSLLVHSDSFLVP